MRTVQLWNNNWIFEKEGVQQAVTLPHTWNAKDGQDGGNDYWRGTCRYRKTFEKPDLTPGEELWLEVRGAAMTAQVFLNGHLQEIAGGMPTVDRTTEKGIVPGSRHATVHEGGYSTFRVNLTDGLLAQNEIVIAVDNGANRRVYPQKADFTFYGGLYRDVYLITVPHEHFALDDHGGPGMKVTYCLSDDLKKAVVTVETKHNASGVTISLGGDHGKAASGIIMEQSTESTADFTIENPHLWNGRQDPYLYRVTARLESGDEVSLSFGIRKTEFDPEKGFLLNGKPLRLVGTARHQDRQGIGNALTRKEHEEDLRILYEMGANTVRLAHYQQDSYVYDLCDRMGLIVWAEIPYITEHMPEARANTISQMTELITQNLHHPSIVCWCLSNEITTTTGVTEDLVENHKMLNDLCHRLDPSRPTTMANVFMLSPDDPLVMLPDIRSFNLYYGWYVGDVEQNDAWFDAFHKAHPDTVIGLSEYGADANPAYHSEKPEKGDWTEEYQAIYHEHMLKMWSERPYIWAMHCWNGFDFGADGRDEGGKPGQNQKGLVTFDRKIRKDAYYIYKAYLSDDPFIHICGRRFIDRPGSHTQIKVYSNQPEVALLVDDKIYETQRKEKVFLFDIPITGEHKINAVSGMLSDTIRIRKMEKPNPDYQKAGSGVINWFDRDDEIEVDGHFSIHDSMASIKSNPAALAVWTQMLEPVQKKVVESYGDVAKNVQIPPQMQAAMDRMSAESSLKQMGKFVTPELVHQLNHALNQVKKLV